MLIYLPLKLISYNISIDRLHNIPAPGGLLYHVLKQYHVYKYYFHFNIQHFFVYLMPIPNLPIKQRSIKAHFMKYLL